MKVLNDNEGLVTNFEVNQILQQNLKGQTEDDKDSPESSFEQQVLKYFQYTTITNQTAEKLQICIKSLQNYELTKAEVLQVLNLHPTTEVEVNLIIEECAERISDEKTLQLLQDLTQTLLSPE